MNETLTLAQRIRSVAGIDPDAEAIEFKGKWKCWRETQIAIDQLEALLKAAGLKSGTPVGILLRNRPQHLLGMAATLANECSIVTMNARQPGEKTREELADLRLPVIMADPDDWADGDLRKLVNDSGALGIELSPDRGLKLLSDFKPEQGPFRHNSPDVAVEMLTSGTTGPPKRVIYGTNNLKRSVMGSARLLPGSNDTPKDQEPKLLLRRGVIVCWAPVLHTAGMWMVIEHFLQGRRLCLLEKFDPVEWARAIKTYQPRMALLSPPVILMVLDAEIPKEDLASLEAVTSGTAPLPVDLERKFETRFQIPILPNYGATEFPGNGAGWTLEDHKKYGESKIGSVGRPRPGVKMRIVDENTGDVLLNGEVGLVELLGRTAATPEGQEPQWLRTTDLAMFDDDGFLWIKGRADSAIIRGGFKVLATDVVKVLEQHPKVKEAAVVGIPDDRLGAVPVAAIIPMSPQDPPSDEDIEAHARKYLSPYQLPVRYIIAEYLPRTPSLKISMPGVKALFGQRDPTH